MEKKYIYLTLPNTFIKGLSEEAINDLASWYSNQTYRFASNNRGFCTAKIDLISKYMGQRILACVISTQEKMNIVSYVKTINTKQNLVLTTKNASNENMLIKLNYGNLMDVCPSLTIIKSDDVKRVSFVYDKYTIKTFREKESEPYDYESKEYNKYFNNNQEKAKKKVKVLRKTTSI